MEADSVGMRNNLGDLGAERSGGGEGGTGGTVEQPWLEHLCTEGCEGLSDLISPEKNFSSPEAFKLQFFNRRRKECRV